MDAASPLEPERPGAATAETSLGRHDQGHAVPDLASSDVGKTFVRRLAA